MSGKVKVWGNVGTVEWADPIEDPDPEVMAKVMTVGLRFSFVVLVGAAEGFREWRKTSCAFLNCALKAGEVFCVKGHTPEINNKCMEGEFRNYSWTLSDSCVASLVS